MQKSRVAEARATVVPTKVKAHVDHISEQDELATYANEVADALDKGAALRAAPDLGQEHDVTSCDLLTRQVIRRLVAIEEECVRVLKL